MLNEYMQAIFQEAIRGDAREESFYPALKELLESYAQSRGRSRVHVTVLPKKTEAGNPDFRIWDGKKHIVGYIEAKKPGTNLDYVEDTEQLRRYLGTFPNIILTNFFEFRFYRDGHPVESVQIGRPFVATTLKKVPPVEKEGEFDGLLEKFFAFSLPRTYTAKALAIELARRTRFLRDEVVAEELREEAEKGTGLLLGFYEAFHKHLLAGLTHEQFADLYSQTVTYGLFAARTRAGEDFNRQAAFNSIPQTIGILRDIFRYISLEILSEQMEWIVDDISEVLAVADINSILQRFYQEHKGRDPVVHFYETFLAEYNPKEKERRGVYYTPEPVVSYICRSVHNALKSVFKLPEGLADTSVRLLDPAAGTLTFPAEAARIAVEEATKYGDGIRSEFIREHILRNFYAFELMMAPYAIGHLKIGFLLEDLGYKLADDEQFQLYLTNTLEMEEMQQSNLPGTVSLARESRLALEVKRDTPILVILGNPPYSGHSSNKGMWISEKIRAYYKVDGAPLDERNTKWLQDDYVKFIRFAQWKIDQAGEGILAFITNHGYLDNPTFRGMRQSLMKTFDQIYLLNMHGNSLKKEICPDGSKDENVFEIKQGVAIAICIKKSGIKKRIMHAEQWGLRQYKYDWLSNNEIYSTNWQPIQPRSKRYLFIPRKEIPKDQYESWPSLQQIFPVNSVGIVTARDHFVIDFDRDALERRIEMFCDESLPDDHIRQVFKLKDSKAWKLSTSRIALRRDEHWRERFITFMYRPFDIRWLLYHDILVERRRIKVMKHMLADNYALISPKIFKEEPGAITTTFAAGHKTVSAYDINYIFPLFLTTDDENGLFAKHQSTPPQANIDDNIYNIINSAIIEGVEPRSVLFYIYAILYSPSYRIEYYEYLKTGFPRIPFTAEVELFHELADYGNRLCDLHLLRSPYVDNPIARFSVRGDNTVKRVHYEEQARRVYINKAQYFEGIAPEVWGYQIGGYQVMAKWLMDRKGRLLSLEDIKHYCRIATALAMTIELQAEIDEIYPEVESQTIKGLISKD